jgi:hypothetical protein
MEDTRSGTSTHIYHGSMAKLPDYLDAHCVLHPREYARQPRRFAIYNC